MLMLDGNNNYMQYHITSTCWSIIKCSLVWILCYEFSKGKSLFSFYFCNKKTESQMLCLKSHERWLPSL